VKKQDQFQVLLVDDDATDRELFIDALQHSGNRLSIAEASNGEEAFVYLAGLSSLPDLIILDLNMPVKDGRQTLKELKENALFRKIPVCIMSTSNAHFDVENAYSIGANLFLVKPLDFREFTEMTSSLLNLFTRFVTLPDPIVAPQ